MCKIRPCEVLNGEHTTIYLMSWNFPVWAYMSIQRASSWPLLFQLLSVRSSSARPGVPHTPDSGYPFTTDNRDKSESVFCICTFEQLMKCKKIMAQQNSSLSKAIVSSKFEGKKTRKYQSKCRKLTIGPTSFHIFNKCHSPHFACVVEFALSKQPLSQLSQ